MKAPIYIGFSRGKYYVAPEGQPVRAWKKTLRGALGYAQRLLEANPETFSQIINQIGSR